MKTFLEFVESLNRLPCIETTFGSHSIKKPLQEAFIPSIKGARNMDHREQIEIHPETTQNDIHNLNYPDKGHEEIKRAHSYTRDSTMMNDFLKTHYKHPEEDARPHEFGTAGHELAEMDSFINSHVAPRDFHVFSGVTKSPVDYHNPQDHDKPFLGHLPHYTSTSTNYHEALSFASPFVSSRPPENLANSNQGAFPSSDRVKHVLKISVPKGTKAVSMRPISEHPTEDEILLHRGHNIEIHPHPTFDPEHNAYVWHSKIVSHTPESVYE